MLRDRKGIFFVFFFLIPIVLGPNEAEAGCKWITRGLKSYLKCTGDIAKAAGKVTETAQKKVGKPVAKGVEHLGKEINKEAIKGGKVVEKGVQDVGKGLENIAHETGKVFDKTGREIGNAGRDINRYAIENPEELIAIAVVAGVAWAACIDGCTFVGGLIIDGATAGGTAGGLISIPLIAIEPGDESDEDRSIQLSRPQNSEPEEQKPQGGESNPEYDPPTEKEYPHKYSKEDHPSPGGLHGKAPIIVYRSPNEQLDKVMNEFSPPSPKAAVRYPDPEYDAAGGVFLSPRSTNDQAAEEAFGDNARRIHAATDFLMQPGQPVLATLTGKVDGAPWEVKPGLYAVNIRAKDETVSRVLYIQPNEKIKDGVEVIAGNTVLGAAGDLSLVPSYQGVPNHVHVDFTDFRGRRFDPWTNLVTEPAPGAQP